MIVLKKNENVICLYYPSINITMVVHSFVIAEHAPISALGVDKYGNPAITNDPPRIGDKLYMLTEKVGEYDYTGIVTAISKSSVCNFSHIPSLNLIIPHDSRPVNPHLGVEMGFGDAVTVTVDFVKRPVISMCGVNVMLKDHGCVGHCG